LYSHSFSWFWILVAATAPFVGGLLVAYPIWRTNQTILGSLAGSAVIFGIAIALIMREHVELDRQVQACLSQGLTCWPDPPAFTRYAIYAGIALMQVMALFSLSLRVEHRLRRRGYDPEWR
jgi:MFS family permease